MEHEADVLDAGPGDHLVLFYRNDDDLTGRVSEYLLRSMRAGGVAIVIATPVHRLSFEGWLADAGLDVAAARASGFYRDLDAGDTMSDFMVADSPAQSGNGRHQHDALIEVCGLHTVTVGVPAEPDPTQAP